MTVLIFVTLWVTFAVGKSVSRCPVGNAVYEEGQVWSDNEECLGHTCLGNNTYNTTECKDVLNENVEDWKVKVGKNPQAFPSCCSNMTSNEELKPCEVDGKIVNIGEQHNFKGQCFQYICLGNEHWSVGACALEGSPAGWTFIMDNSKPYPECCGRVVPLLNVTPDVLDKLNHMFYLDITYHSDFGVATFDTINFIFHADQGNVLSPLYVKKEPVVNYTADPADLYLLVMLDPDFSTQDKDKQFLHWLVSNIPGSNVTSGDVLVRYLRPWPARDSGTHRYFFFIYKQLGELTRKEIQLDTLKQRETFSLREFSKRYNLTDPIGMNVFQSRWHLELKDFENNSSKPTN
ncbi:uncharacterized protein LOC124356237 [Homalodisca vitripennis]|uniref:uncharacterized protein LOC124356237 n=1 Tax=Homalodisca vitripennis TaxID=197043 RepID=UPI001EEA3318|nr:uncharacterized protein LOC124356237 [Homalodisca vitripennis]